MSFKHCPNCGGLLRAPDLKAGHAVRCNKCGYTFAVPDHVPGGHSAHRDAEREERQRRHRGRSRSAKETDASPGEWLVPTALLVVGLMLALSGIFVHEGAAGVRGLLILIAVNLAVTIPITIAAMYVAAAVLGTSFGALGTAILKLVAINVLYLGIVLTGTFVGAPVIGLVVGVVVSWVLFSFLFDLAWYETLISLLIIGLIHFFAGRFLEAVVISALK
jgi:hypothetical protein